MTMFLQKVPLDLEPNLESNLDGFASWLGEIRLINGEGPKAKEKQRFVLKWKRRGGAEVQLHFKAPLSVIIAGMMTNDLPWDDIPCCVERTKAVEVC